jgi:putative membrane protein
MQGGIDENPVDTQPDRRRGADATLALSATACSLPNKPATTAAAEVSEPMSSGEILGVLEAVNQGEIEQAYLALFKSDNPHVQEVARVMIEEHMLSNERIAFLAQNEGLNMKESPLSEGVLTQAQEIRANLAELSGREFDRRYLQNQVELHEVAIDTVRNQLLPSAEDQDIRQLLNSTVRRLNLHRGEARESYAAVTDGNLRG